MFKLTKVANFPVTVYKMGELAWQAHSLFFTGLLLLELLQGLIPLAIAWLIKIIFDSIQQSLYTRDSNIFSSTLIVALICQALLIIINQVTNPLKGFFSAELERRLTLTIQLKIYRKINDFNGIEPFENSRFYDTIQLATQGAQVGPSQTIRVFTTIVRNISTLIAFLAILFYFSPLLVLAVLLAALPQLYVQLRIGKQRFDLAFENSRKQRLTSYYGMLLSGIQFVKEMRVLNLSDHFLRLFQLSSEEVHRSQRRQQLREVRWQILIAIVACVISNIAFIVVILQTISGRFTLGDVTFYISAVTSLQTALGSLIYSISQLSESALFFSRFENLMLMPQPLQKAQNTRPLPLLNSSITFRNVSFRYNEEQPWILEKLNLTIPVGKSVALVGLNGAGKTTLVKLLARFYDPNEGYILWDGIDIKDCDITELRQRIGPIFQDFIHYDLSVQDNIGLGNIAVLANQSKIQQAAIKADVHTTVEKLPQGYETVLSRWLNTKDTGVDLSGGEWQKIALARMFVREAELLILDEPTAALDIEAELQLYNRFVELMKGRTCVLITHRFGTARLADLVAVLENGSIAEYGTHNELLKFNGIYANLYNLQAAQYHQPNTA